MQNALARAVEVARNEGWVEDDVLVVWDRLGSPGGTRLEVCPTAHGFRAYVRNRCGSGCMVSCPSELDAVTSALSGYLDIVNNGI